MLERRRPLLKKPRPEAEKKEILNYWDRDVLKTGINNLTLKIIEDFGGKLPDAIILPDTSARPLMYALRPAFEAVAKEKGCRIPQIYFFKTDKSTSNEHAKEMVAARKVMQERAREIMGAEEKAGRDHPSMAIIDEYATEDANAIGEMRRAFGEAIPAYPVFSDSWGGQRFTPGVRIPWNLEHTNPSMPGIFKFSYSGENAVGVKKTTFDGEKYARRIEPAHAKEAEQLAATKKSLRGEMRLIGESVAEHIQAGDATAVEPTTVGKIPTWQYETDATDSEELTAWRDKRSLLGRVSDGIRDFFRR